MYRAYNPGHILQSGISGLTIFSNPGIPGLDKECQIVLNQRGFDVIFYKFVNIVRCILYYQL